VLTDFTESNPPTVDSIFGMGHEIDQALCNHAAYPPPMIAALLQGFHIGVLAAGFAGKENNAD